MRVISTRVHITLRFDRIPSIGVALWLEIKPPCSHHLSIVALGGMTTRSHITALSWATPADGESVLGSQIGTDETHALALKFSYKTTEDDGSQINKFAYGIYPMRISQAVYDDLSDGWLTNPKSTRWRDVTIEGCPVNMIHLIESLSDIADTKEQAKIANEKWAIGQRKLSVLYHTLRHSKDLADIHT